MSILPLSLSVPATPQSLSSGKALSGGPIWAQSLCLAKKLSHLSLKTTPIRMGGGPRTYPGGVSKWQWKRMQAKKAKQLLKARLARERQIYEMRKRAELKAAVSELERPWEAVEKPPNLFSVSADEQLKVLADRFQKPGGLDLWSERDGPELFRHDNGLPSSRFFPKGVVHSIQPYRKTGKSDTNSDGFEGSGLGEDLDSGRVRANVEKTDLGGNVGGIELRSSDGAAKEGQNRDIKGKFRKKGNRKMYKSAESERMDSGNLGIYDRKDRVRGGSPTEIRRSNGVKKGQKLDSEVFDMSLQNDGSYGLEFGELR
ncbi:probable DEAD-box ATP-dependent RNA helicase 48 [Salvia miltiorrhiza]|uniref:probable DEAD-box ATP-dependent RNA helicase 48 n=1 Tax=Salvia miltiorrhiza TaxID=226208 RepID=UPI0025ABEB79|nr:probable DEAD-box ATP-dependent RNA helicase 48 [Salvia miltiorrhiza]XP_057807990.1 probable DEAD-box ATP-dependent RNA helicase 48 [Salvia miltiorrhiza]XP_057807991.1 probable DEAD-box ATP-dependent RNA helicase 48 [Salvia miltiorrhiza]